MVLAIATAILLVSRRAEKEKGPAAAAGPLSSVRDT
jgi:hypothetical protein